jgi:hypothetical protein
MLTIVTFITRRVSRTSVYELVNFLVLVQPNNSTTAVRDGQYFSVSHGIGNTQH